MENLNNSERATKAFILLNINALINNLQDMEEINEVLLKSLPSYLIELQNDLNAMNLNKNFYRGADLRYPAKYRNDPEKSLSIIPHEGNGVIYSAPANEDSSFMIVHLPDLSVFAPASGLGDLFNINSEELELSNGGKIPLALLTLPKAKILEMFALRNRFLDEFDAESEKIAKEKEAKLMGGSFEMCDKLNEMSTCINEFIENKKCLLQGQEIWESELEIFLDKVVERVELHRESIKNAFK